MIGVPRIACGTERGGFRGAPHGELVQVGLSDQNTTGAPQPFRDSGLVGGHETLQHPAGAGGGHTPGAEVVLDGERDSRQRSKRLPSGAGEIDAISIGPGSIRCDVQKGVDLILGLCRPLEMLFHKLTSRDLPALQLLTPRADRHRPGFMSGRRYQSCAQPSAAMVSGSPRRVRSRL